MKVIINRANLLRQLPDNDTWDQVVLEVQPYEEKKDYLKEKYKDIFNALTVTEWKIFKELLQSKKISIDGILKYTNSRTSLTSNNAAVHIKGIRGKLKQLNSKFEIVTGKIGYSYWELKTKKNG